MLHAEAVVDAFDLEARGLDEHLELVVGCLLYTSDAADDQEVV